MTRALRIALPVLALLAFGVPSAAAASPEDGSALWLRYVRVDNTQRLGQYRSAISRIVVENADRNKVHRHTPDLRMEAGSSETLVESTLEAARDELARGLRGLLDQPVPVGSGAALDGAVVVGTRDSSELVRRHVPAGDLATLGDEGYLIRSVSQGRSAFTIVAGNTELGALYGTFAFLRRIQT